MPIDHLNQLRDSLNKNFNDAISRSSHKDINVQYRHEVLISTINDILGDDFYDFNNLQYNYLNNVKYFLSSKKEFNNDLYKILMLNKEINYDSLVHNVQNKSYSLNRKIIDFFINNLEKSEFIRKENQLILGKHSPSPYIILGVKSQKWKKE